MDTIKTQRPAATHATGSDKTGVKSINEYEFRLIREHIHNYCGIYFDDSRALALAPKLSFRMKLLDIPCYMEYYNYLKFNPGSKDEIEALVPHLTNNETYFFREINQISVLVSELMEKMRKNAKSEDRRIRIISCGCSSGEEAYTLAMLLEESGAFQFGWEIEIIGLDIDQNILEKAVNGTYTSYSLRAAEESQIKKYFKREGERYILDDKIRSRVSFKKGNLLEEIALDEHGGIDAILCRNVFIYFSDGAIKKVAESFHEALSDGGYLLLGHSESLSRITDLFHPKRYPTAIVYTKKDL